MVPQYGMSIFHIVTSLSGLSGAETHSATLGSALRQAGHDVQLWSDRATPFVARFGGKAINAFGGAMPRGGTLVVVGCFVSVMPWIDYARPERLILVCINSDPDSLHTMLGKLGRPDLPETELVYVSSRLRDAMGVPGIVCPEMMDLDVFHPASPKSEGPLTIGRLSRDVAEKHHPDDPSLYRMLAWNGFRVRIMGGTVLHEALADMPEIELLPAGAEPAPEFLRSLDVFFYRTAPSWHEPSGRVVMEALASGLPVVAHASGGYTDWITQGENGYVFGTQEEAWNCLQYLHNDAVARNRMADAARRAAIALSGPAASANYLSWLAGARVLNSAASS